MENKQDTAQNVRLQWLCRIGAAVCLALILVTVAMIWMQSTVNQSTSAAQSGTVAEHLPIPLEPSGPVQTGVRKSAHLVEFSLLGAECALWWKLRRPRWRQWLILLPGVVVSVADEWVFQLLNDRGSSVTDTLLDWFGYAIGLAAVFGLATLIGYAHRRGFFHRKHP